MLTISKLIAKLEAVKEVEGDLPVVLSAPNFMDQFIEEDNLSSGRLEDWVDEEVCLGSDVEEYHQVFVFTF